MSSDTNTGPRRTTKYALASLVMGIGACLLMGARETRNLPLDDSYIHLSYGIDFDPRTMFSFQGGHRDTGTSSWVWTTIAILVVRLRLPEHAVLTALGVAILCGVLHRVMVLVDRALPPDVPFRAFLPYLSAILVVKSGNVLWFSLSGMETGLMVLLLLLAIPRMLVGRGMTVGAGALALLLVWTRIEGLVWVVTAALLLPFVAREGGSKRAKIGWIFPLTGVALYVAYNLAVGGHPLPTTALGKRATFVPGGHSFKEEWEFVRAVVDLYFGHHLPGFLIESAVVLSASATLAFGALIRWRFRGRPSISPTFAPVFALVAGAFAHAALNVVTFRSAYHHLRYFAPLLYLTPAFAIALLVAATWPLLLAGARRSRAQSPTLTAGLVMAAAMPVFIVPAMRADLRMAPLWATLYRRNAEQLGAVHLAVGEYVRALPGVARVASFDIGALRWASRLQITDLAGTSDARALSYRTGRRHPDMLRDDRADVFVSIDNGFDYIQSYQRTYDLEMIEAWQYPEYIDPFPTHARRMVLYRVLHCGAPARRRSYVGQAISFEVEASDKRGRSAIGTGEGTSFERWPTLAKELPHPILHQQGRFLSSDAHPLGDKAVGRFESAEIPAMGDFVTFRIGGGYDPDRLRVELWSEGEVEATWTGFDSDALLEIVHPIAYLRGATFSFVVVDESTAPMGHITLDEVRQFGWREIAARPCR